MARDLSVIIVNYNTARFLARCLRSLETCLTGLTYDICVVDNASTDGSQALVTERFPRVHLIANARNLGFSAGLNVGFRRTQGRYLLWLNPDAELQDHGMAELIRYLDRHPRVGILGPLMVNPMGRREFSCRSFPSYRTALFHRYSMLTRWFPGNPYTREYLHPDWDDATPRDVDWVSGACLLHRREVLNDVEGVDERFFVYCEDTDFCLRARQHGWLIQYHPGARVFHEIGGYSRQAPHRMLLVRHRSMWRYYAKHFRRHPLKDAVVGAAIWSRCGYIMVRQTLRGRAPPTGD